MAFVLKHVGVISCDGCGSMSKTVERFLTEGLDREARRVAIISQQWHREDGHDMCPSCWRKWVENNPPSFSERRRLVRLRL